MGHGGDPTVWRRIFGLSSSENLVSECPYCHVVEVECCNCHSVLVLRRGSGVRRHVCSNNDVVGVSVRARYRAPLESLPGSSSVVS